MSAHSSPHRWGDLRAWLSSPTLDGAALHAILSPWHRAAQEEVFEAVLPYLFDRLSKHPSGGVAQRSQFPYGDFVDTLLKRAMSADRDSDTARALTLYSQILLLKPDCIPARVSAYRLERAEEPLESLLEREAFEAHGSYGKLSWLTIREKIVELDRIAPAGESDGAFSRALKRVRRETEEHYTIYPCTLFASHALIMMMGRLERPMSALHIEQSAEYVQQMLLQSMFAPYSYGTIWNRMIRGERTVWPPEKIWSFVDPLLLHYEELSELHRALPDSAERLHVEERRYAVYLIEETLQQDYEEHQACALPFFESEAFTRGKKNLVLEAIGPSTQQTINAGIPIYQRLIDQRGLGALPKLEALLWHTGHMARQSQEAIRERVGDEHVWQLTMTRRV